MRVIGRSVVWFRYSLISVTLTVVPSASTWSQPAGGETDVAFSEAYAAYTSAIEAGDDAAALTAARQAYENGSAHFGRFDGNTGALAMNYGNMLARSGTDNAAAVRMFIEADAIYEVLYGSASAERLEALLALASVQETFDQRLATINAALTMHRILYPGDAIAYARLQSQGGELLAAASSHSSEARTMLSEALDTLEAEFGEDSPELFSTLLALGNTLGEGPPSRRQLAYFDRAVAIVRAAGSEEAAADLELGIALQLNRQSSEYRDAIPYIRSAHAGYDRLFGPGHPKTASAALILGQALMAIGDTKEGVNYVSGAIAFYENEAADVSTLFRARQLLMSAYLRLGDDERYTEQLREMSRLPGGSPPGEYLPIVKVAPAYPSDAAVRGIGGYVIVQYTVDEEGRTRDVVVLESGSERGSGEVFESTAVASARKYRYLPRFENGVPVSVPGVTTRIEFAVE